MAPVTGLHHITAIAGDPQQNLDFYTRVLGLRLVKQTVNQDAIDTYHFFYADAVGHPGTDLTFFPWPAMAAGRAGAGFATEVAFAVPSGSLDFWRDRLRQRQVPTFDTELRFGERTLPFTDPHGLSLALTESDEPRQFASWAGSEVPPQWQIRGLHGARMWESDLESTCRLLTKALGLAEHGRDRDWVRMAAAAGGSGTHVDVRQAPSDEPGRPGPGTIHHIAWRVGDDAAELETRADVIAAGLAPTPVIDRFWFKSVYFREPGGVLFELATEGPGFAADEDPAELGGKLILPPWLEARRTDIEAMLPPVETGLGST